MNPEHQNAISRVAAESARLLEGQGPRDLIDALWNGSANYANNIPVEDITEMFDGTGVDQAVINEAAYAVSVVRNTIRDHVAALAIIANVR